MTGRRKRYGPGPAIVAVAGIIVLISIAEVARSQAVTGTAAASCLVIAATWLTGYASWKNRP